MKRLKALIMAVAMVVSLSSCATSEIGQSTSAAGHPANGMVAAHATAPWDNTSQPPGSVPVMTTTSASPINAPTNAPAAAQPANSFLTRVADVVVYGNTRIAPAQGGSIREIIKRRIASGYYHDAMTRAYNFQSQVSFDQQQINMFQTLLP
jgi:hypothetical protein